MYLDAPDVMVSSRTLMVAQISWVNIDAKSGNLMEMMVFDGKIVVQAREIPSNELFV